MVKQSAIFLFFTSISFGSVQLYQPEDVTIGEVRQVTQAWQFGSYVAQVGDLLTVTSIQVNNTIRYTNQNGDQVRSQLGKYFDNTIPYEISEPIYLQVGDYIIITKDFMTRTPQDDFNFYQLTTGTILRVTSVFDDYFHATLSPQYLFTVRIVLTKFNQFFEIYEDEVTYPPVPFNYNDSGSAYSLHTLRWGGDSWLKYNIYNPDYEPYWDFGLILKIDYQINSVGIVPHNLDQGSLPVLGGNDSSIQVNINNVTLIDHNFFGKLIADPWHLTLKDITNTQLYDVYNPTLPYSSPFNQYFITANLVPLKSSVKIINIGKVPLNNQYTSNNNLPRLNLPFSINETTNEQFLKSYFNGYSLLNITQSTDYTGAINHNDFRQVKVTKDIFVLYTFIYDATNTSTGVTEEIVFEVSCPLNLVFTNG